MGCWTAYLIRDVDRTWRAYGERDGAWRMLEASERDELLATVRADGWSLDPSPERPFWGPAYCQGVLLDVVERRLRVYACESRFHRPACGWVESFERALVAAPAWSGWDVGYAWAGRDELLARVPEATGHIEPESFEALPLERLPASLPDAEGWLVDWDRAHMRLSFRYGPESSGGLLTVIHETLAVIDYDCGGTFEHGNLPWLLHARSLLDALDAATPCPVPSEADVDHGVIIDCPARRLRYWAAHPLPHGLREGLARAWPGYAIERLTHGFAGHLAATGRRCADLLIADAELLSPNAWGEPVFDAGWVRERAELPLDPRDLRHVDERLLVDG